MKGADLLELRSITGVKRTQFNHRLDYEIRFDCSDHHYGPECGRFCKPFDDKYHGHYNCDELSGEKICKNGWMHGRDNDDEIYGKSISDDAECIKRKYSQKLISSVLKINEI